MPDGPRPDQPAIYHLRPAAFKEYGKDGQLWPPTGSQARIFAVVDVWDALRSDRPYRKSMSQKEAIDYITTQSGKHFDPVIVEKSIEFLKD